MGKIPYASPINPNPIPSADSLRTTNNGIVFSFEILERTEYFNIDGTCNNWYSEMLERFKEISKLSVGELTSRKYRMYRFHQHENANCPSPLPDGIDLKDVYQIRFGSSKGGVHGILRENCFYVLWLDPLHNMYPDDRFGGLRKVHPPKTCCMEREEEIIRLQDELKKARDEAEEWERFAEQLMKEKDTV